MKLHTLVTLYSIPLYRMLHYVWMLGSVW